MNLHNNHLIIKIVFDDVEGRKSVRVKCRDQTVVNNLFKLSNLIDKFFIRIKHSKNKQNRVH